MFDINTDPIIASLNSKIVFIGSKESKGLDNKGRVLLPHKLKIKFFERGEYLKNNSLYYCLGERRDYNFCQVWDYHPVLTFETDFIQGDFIDKSGRVTVPKNFRGLLEGPITFLALGTHIEIWRGNDLEKYMCGIPKLCA